MSNSISQDIIFDKLLLDNPIHKNNIKIASLNLDDFNIRTKLDVKITYIPNIENPTKSIFKKNKLNYLSDNVFDTWCKINWFIGVSYHPQESLNSWSNHIYPDRIINQYECICLTSDEKTQETHNFITLFRNHYPLGFLTIEQQNLIQGKLNEYCEIIEKDHL